MRRRVPNSGVGGSGTISVTTPCFKFDEGVGSATAFEYRIRPGWTVPQLPPSFVSDEGVPGLPAPRFHLAFDDGIE